ncbi:MAG TPA: 50S ribosomal protein L7/L12 [Planctomycetes bacterium]|nr:50S ribosomal protein L7/L12 [Planctomycetota bacterium]
MSSETKTADPVVGEIVEKVKTLTALQLKQLVDELSETFGVDASAPVMGMAMMPGAMAGAAGAEQAAEEKSAFDVVITEIGDKKIQLIKVVREVTGLALKEAKELVEAAPKAVKEKLPVEEAQALKAKLEEAGATVELK